MANADIDLSKVVLVAVKLVLYAGSIWPEASSKTNLWSWKLHVDSMNPKTFLNNYMKLSFIFKGLSGELIPFLCSGSHVYQKDCQPSAIHTFTEALSISVPPISVRPCVLKVRVLTKTP